MYDVLVLQVVSACIVSSHGDGVEKAQMVVEWKRFTGVKGLGRFGGQAAESMATISSLGSLRSETPWRS